MAKIKAAVIFGGVSREHDISLASAAEVICNIPKDKYEVICLGITRKGRWLYFPGDPQEIADGSWEQDPDCTSAIISPDPIHRGIITIENGETSVKRIDVVFPLLQGKHGADGTIQGLLDMSGIPYVGCGLLSSAACMDKSHTHMIMDDFDIATAEWQVITQPELSRLDQRCKEIADKLGFPVIVKPANSESSSGVSKANDLSQLETAVKIAFSNDNKVVIEKYIEGRKLEAAVFGYDSPVASFIGEIVSTAKPYDHYNFTVHSGDDLIVPADLDRDTQSMVRDTAVRAYKAMGCKGMARLDFFLTSDGKLLLNKIGTAPGMRSKSVFPKLMASMGMKLPELIDTLLEQAIDSFDRNY